MAPNPTMATLEDDRFSPAQRENIVLHHRRIEVMARGAMRRAARGYIRVRTTRVVLHLPMTANDIAAHCGGNDLVGDLEIPHACLSLRGELVK